MAGASARVESPRAGLMEYDVMREVKAQNCVRSGGVIELFANRGGEVSHAFHVGDFVEVDRNLVAIFQVHDHPHEIERIQEELVEE